jgi:hypothetical protein
MCPVTPPTETLADLAPGAYVPGVCCTPLVGIPIALAIMVVGLILVRFFRSAKP